MSQENKSVELAQAPKEKTYQDLQQEYTALCNKAGHLQYQIFGYQKDLDLINSELRELNFKAAAVQAREQQKSAEAALEKSKKENN